MRAHPSCIAAVAVVLALAPLVAACSSSAPGTTVRLEVTYDDAWSLSRFSLSADGRSDTTSVARSVTVVLPDDMAEREITIDLWGHRGDVRYAHGEAKVTPRRGGEVRAAIVLARVPCGAWCTLGATSCQGDATVICEQRDDDGCFEWSEPTDCAAATPFCSLGVCAAACIDECELGDTRCAGPGGVQTCGDADSDPCNDWLPVAPCGDGDTCSNGACSATCQDECAAGATECLGAGTVACGDLDGDGCREWGPIVPCGAGDSCSNGVCTTSCSDECSVSSCSGLSFTACGQYDLDPCKDRSPGVSCVPSDPCREGSCAAASGCSSAPKICDMAPESTCVDDHTLRVYQAQGSCQTDGSCDYTFEDRACANCPACDPCEGVTCNSPPPPTACYVAAGTCGDDGACAYAYNDSATCNDGNACTLNDSCDTGVCSGTPKTCNAPPANECLSTTTLRSYTATGTCVSATGDCSYGHTDMTCTYGCTGNACQAPPAWIAVSAGDSFTCGIRGTGTLACWGSNVEGQATPPAGTYTSISAGDDHACAIRTDKTLACWGSNENSRATPPGGAFKLVSAGNMHTCAIRENDTVVCWGFNGYGQSVPPSGTFSVVSAGAQATLGLRTTGVLAFWGNNAYNLNEDPGGVLVNLEAGPLHACGVRTDGTMACWGNNTYLQTMPPSGSYKPKIGSGYGYSCAIRTDGKLACWGRDYAGATSPPSGTFSEVTAGYSHACAIRTGGALACWGQDIIGETSPPP